ncbi:hypothetical protein I4F81_008609 [Pyropia yezoensis]|uniref:Uncharacterized protein n=1 Tax=Pyropia yezoensis TaxID=2788 RepID=A0ACC3C703_PYRYE|nr:hypothetical protein I4F81_008609 [Neopyropia yezoensis]
MARAAAGAAAAAAPWTAGNRAGSAGSKGGTRCVVTAARRARAPPPPPRAAAALTAATVAASSGAAHHRRLEQGLQYHGAGSSMRPLLRATKEADAGTQQRWRCPLASQARTAPSQLAEAGKADAQATVASLGTSPPPRTAAVRLGHCRRTLPTPRSAANNATPRRRTNGR